MEGNTHYAINIDLETVCFHINSLILSESNS
jgi:hypothetical protein